MTKEKYRHIDCAFWKTPRRCAALIRKECDGCPFFITKKELDRKNFICEMRIKDSPNYKHIMEKYYGGEKKEVETNE